MEISCRVYRPRKARESPLFQLVERHLEELLRVWPQRFARQRGPLRAVVERVLREFLRCGLLEHGFARIWCAECRRSVLVAFSCRGRSFCPSCEKKRQILWAEWLCEEVLAKVAHRHVVLTIPRLLRPLFRRRRELLTELGRAAAEATTELVRRGSAMTLAPASSSRSPPLGIWFSGTRACTCSRPTAARRRTVPGGLCRNGTLYC